MAESDSAPQPSPARRSSAGLWLVMILVLGTFGAAITWNAIHVKAPAPAFALTSTGFEDGVLGPPVNFTLADYRGKTVILDLMAVACTSCRDVTAHVLKPIWSQHADQVARGELAVLSIDTWADPGTGAALGGETRATLIQQQRDDGVPWRHALDTDRVWQKYAAVSLPRIVVVDPAGLVVYDQLGTPREREVEAVVEASIAGSAAQVPSLRLGLSGLAAVAGVAAVLSPCSIGLLPTYLALLLAPAAGDENAEPQQRVLRRRFAVLRAALACAAGILLVYALLAVLFSLGAASIQAALPRLGPVVAVLMILAGAWTLTGRGSVFLAKLGARVGHERGLFFFGVAFALCGFGCTGPLFLPILVAGFAISTGAGTLLFLLYAGAVAAVVLAIAAAVEVGAEGPLRRALRHSRRITQVAAATMLLAGVYLLWYFAR